ncbi:MAG: hypothetical protein LUQ31_06400 [Methanoregula sp.]|nr:hypothetical protein [Methanoregula sp.]
MDRQHVQQKSPAWELKITKKERIDCGGFQKMIASRAGNYKKRAGPLLQIVKKERGAS